jgi:hypothetical protein
LFYITGGAPQVVPGTACVEANRTACTEDPCSSEWYKIVFCMVIYLACEVCWT